MFFQFIQIMKMMKPLLRQHNTLNIFHISENKMFERQSVKPRCSKFFFQKQWTKFMSGVSYIGLPGMSVTLVLKT